MARKTKDQKRIAELEKALQGMLDLWHRMSGGVSKAAKKAETLMRKSDGK
jgi:hypothetical protein